MSEDEMETALIRLPLTPPQEASAIFRRKATYEELHPETKHGANQHTRGVENFATPADRFTAATANATGKSERAVRMASARGEALGDDLGATNHGKPT